MSKEADWFRDAKWGVFVHYLGGKDPEEWNTRTEAFDLKTLAQQLKEINPGYFFITLGQNSGFCCAPNATYERYGGYGTHERCSRRDIPMEIGQELRKHGIRLMLYMSGCAPQSDEQEAKGLGCVERAYGSPGWWDWGMTPLFNQRWSEVLQTWAEQYGELVSGWWIDGCYTHVGARNEYMNSYQAALRKGNPHTICAFNSGVRVPVTRAFDADDYTAGELDSNFPVGVTDYGKDMKFCRLNEADGAQYHLVTFLGERWGSHAPRFSDELVHAYTRWVTDSGGVLTWDVGIYPDGHLSGDCVRQLRCLKDIRR